MKKMIIWLVVVIGLFFCPQDLFAQKKKPRAKTDPTLTVSKKKSKQVKKKIIKRKARTEIYKRQDGIRNVVGIRKEELLFSQCLI